MVESFKNNVEKSVGACEIFILVIDVGILIQHLTSIVAGLLKLTIVVHSSR